MTEYEKECMRFHDGFVHACKTLKENPRPYDITIETRAGIVGVYLVETKQ